MVKSNTVTCNVQDVVEFVASVTSAGFLLHQSRPEAAQVHPVRERQAMEKYLSPHTFLQSYLKLVWLPKAALGSYSLPSGALGQPSGHWSGLLFFAVVSAHIAFSMPGTSFSPFGPG